jgi:hypothetical protein
VATRQVFTDLPSNRIFEVTRQQVDVHRWPQSAAWSENARLAALTGINAGKAPESALPAGAESPHEFEKAKRQ